MFQKIKDRLTAMEKVREKAVVPDVVFISWSDSQNSWIASERYYQHDAKGKIIHRNGRTRNVKMKNIYDYEKPEGFEGVVYYEGRLE